MTPVRRDRTGPAAGRLGLELIDCNHAMPTWETDRAGFADDTLALERLSAQQDVECAAPSVVPGGSWHVIDPQAADPM